MQLEQNMGIKETKRPGLGFALKMMLVILAISSTAETCSSNGKAAQVNWTFTFHDIIKISTQIIPKSI